MNNLVATTKMVLLSAAGVTISVQDVESYLRISSLLLTMGLSVLVFIRNGRKRKNGKND